MPIPEPKPGDLMNPVPGADSAPDLGEMLKSAPKPAPAAAAPSQPSAAPSQNAMPDLGQMLQSSAAPAPTDNSDIDPNAPSAGSSGEVTNAQGNQFPTLNPSNMVENLKELKTLAVANLDKDPKKQLEVWKQAFGDKNAKVVGDQIYFKSGDDAKFRPATKGLFDGILNVLASHSRDVAFTAGAIAAPEVMGAAGLVSEGVLGTAASGMAAAATGGATAQAADNAARGVLGVSPSNDTIAGEANSAGKAGFLLSGGMALASPVLSSVAEAGGDIAQDISNKAGEVFNTKNSRLGKIINLYRDATDVAMKSGMNIDTSDPSTDSTAIGEYLGGKKVQDSTLVGPPHIGQLRAVQKQLSSDIGVMLDHADQIAEGERTQLPLEGIKSSMKRAGFEFQTERVPLPMAPSSEISFEDVNSHDGSPREFTIEKAVPKPDILGEPNRANVQEIADRFNELQLRNKAGGFLPSELADTTQTWQKLGEFDAKNPKSDAVNGLYQNASGSMASARDKVLQDLSPRADPELRDYFTNAYSKAAQNTQYINEYLQDFKSSNSAADFADSLLGAKNASNYGKVNFLKNFLGEGSPQWAAIKGNWFARLITDNSDNNIWNAGKIQDALDQYDPKVLDQLISPQDQMALKYSLKKLDTISTTDFIKKPASLDATNFLVAKLIKAPIAAGASAINLVHKFVFNVAKANGPLADYLATDGFLESAKAASTPTEKASFLKLADSLRQSLSYSEKIPDAAVGYIYKPRPGMESIANAPIQNPGPNHLQQQMPAPPRQTHRPFQPKIPSAQPAPAPQAGSFGNAVTSR